MPTYGKQAGSGTGTGLAPIADQTIEGNISGAPATPVGLTSAQVLTMLGVTPFADRRSSTLIRAQALLGNTVNVISDNEFDRTGTFVATLSGSATAALSSTAKAGVMRLQSGTTAISNSAVTLGGQSVWASVIDNQKTSRWYAYWRVKMVTAGDSASAMDCQLNAGGNSRIFIGQSGDVSSTTWRVNIFDGGGTLITNSAVVAAVDTNWHDVEVWNDTTNITVAIDGVQQYQALASALASGGAMGQRIVASNGATAANRELDVDYMAAVVQAN